ncbi:GH25 family lysozyme [Limosilactobacillus oris]|uniref:GH25 family lysozyme n=1 Tax=Limosilactobacillus oris TaxID=1632 RepID=UPI0018837CA2|nr:GH25 family lysozyme [Limosilactobacillus oris]MBF0600865.1 hypothetical protein [Limosilactobacillus oris]
MANANVIDISYFQDSSKLDWQAIKDAGIEAVIIRAGYGKTQDTQAAAHIANANKYGLKWHLYHYWYNMGGEAEFAVQNAKSLGLTSSQYLFLDMEDKSLPADWNGQFAVFRKAVGDIFQVGLYCSDSPYKAKFQDSQLQQLKVYRWVASYSYEPANYDMWQMSGAGSGGFGKYTADIDRDFDKSRRLIADSEPQSPDKQPIVPPTLTTDMPYIRGIVSQPGFDTESGIWGYGYSPDNGEHFYVNDTVFGRKYRQKDADRLWPYLKDFVSEQLASAVSLDWNNIKNKPDVALKSDLPVVPTDLVHTAELEKVKSDVTQAKQDAAQAVANTESAKVTIDTSNIHQIKKPSEYSEGFSYELKEVSALIPDRSNLDSTAQDGFQAIVTTEVCKGYARQTLKVIDSQRPLTFIRNGYGSTWYPFELVTTW